MAELSRKIQRYHDLINGVPSAPGDQALLQAGYDLASEVTTALNTLGTEHERIAAFINGMRRQHRTLQQAFMRLVMGWIAYQADAPDHEFDLRNAASHALAKQIVAAVPDRYLPLI